MKRLIKTLGIYSELYSSEYSYERLIEDLPYKEQDIDNVIDINDEQIEFVLNRICETASLKYEIKDIAIEDISLLDLPCIAFVNNDFCIIEELDENDGVKIIMNIDDETITNKIPFERFKKVYLNKTIFLKKKYIFNEKEDKRLGLGIKHWLRDTLKLSKKIYLDVILASILINLFVLATPLFTMNVYDRVIPNNAIETLWFFAVGVILVYFLDAGLKFIRTYFLELAAKKSDSLISLLLYEKILNVKLSKTPKSVGLFANDIKGFDQIRTFLANASLTLLIDLPFGIIFLMVIAYIGGSIVIIPLITMVLILTCSYFINKYLQKEIEKSHHLYAKKNSILIETISNLELFKSFGKLGWLKQKWETVNTSLVEQSLKSRTMASSISITTGLLIQLNTVLVVIYGVYEIYEVNLTMGGLIAVMILSTRLVSPMAQVSTLLMNYNDAKNAYKRLDEFIKKEDEKDLSKQYIQLENGFDVDIEFKNVCFKYEGSNSNTIENLSFKIKKNQKVAFVGRIGSGKTTVLKLLMGYYTATSGKILFDGIEISELNPTKLRENIGFVPQNNSLFAGTLRENIIAKNSLIKDEELIRTLQLVGMEEFVKSNEQGLDMLIGENGQGLSGGQIQSLSIARACITNPQILMFDEPTSALDQISESMLLRKLEVEIKDKTSVFVTQKISLLNLVDRIIVLEQGQIYLDDKKEIVIEKLAKA